MICRKCGTRIPDDIEYCPQCMAPVQPVLEEGDESLFTAVPPEEPAKSEAAASWPERLPAVEEPAAPPGDWSAQRYPEGPGISSYREGAYPVRGGLTAGRRGKLYARYDVDLSALVFGSLTALSGIVVLYSTWLRWFTISGEGVTFSLTGYELAFPPALVSEEMAGGNILFMTEPFMFTGFWSIILGLTIMAAALLLLMRRRAGTSVSIVAGVFGGIIAVVDVVQVYRKFQLTTYRELQLELADLSISVNMGLWLLLGLSVGAIVLAYLSLRRVDFVC